MQCCLISITEELIGFEYDGEHCNSPLYADGFIYFISNDNEGDGAVKLELAQNGEHIKQVWSNKQIHNNFNGYVKVDNKLYSSCLKTHKQL